MSNRVTLNLQFLPIIGRVCMQVRTRESKSDENASLPKQSTSALSVVAISRNCLCSPVCVRPRVCVCVCLALLFLFILCRKPTEKRLCSRRPRRPCPRSRSQMKTWNRQEGKSELYANLEMAQNPRRVDGRYGFGPLILVENAAPAQ